MFRIAIFAVVLVRSFHSGGSKHFLILVFVLQLVASAFGPSSRMANKAVIQMNAQSKVNNFVFYRLSALVLVTC